MKADKNRVPAYGYLRVSSKGQTDGDGFPRQEEVIKAYAEKAGYQIVQFYREEGVSGTKGEADRPAFTEMVSSILANGVRVIIVEGMDRLAREATIQDQLLCYIAAKGIALISARTEENITEAIESDPMRKAMVQIQAVFSELEKNMLVKKLKAARERKKAAGGHSDGRYKYEESDPELVRTIRELRRKPKGKPRMTYAAVAEELNRRGFRPQKKAKEGFNAQDVANILHALAKRS